METTEIEIEKESTENLRKWEKSLDDWLRLPGAMEDERFFNRHRALQRIVAELVKRDALEKEKDTTFENDVVDALF